MKESKTQTTLAVLIFLFSVCLFYYTGYWAQILHQLPRFFGTAMGFTYLFGPLLYFYIRSGKSNVYYSHKHLLPFACYVAYFIYQTYFLQVRSTFLDFVQTLIQNGHLLMYVFLIYRNIQKNINQGAQLQLWRTQLLIAYTGYVISFLAYYILVWTGLLKIEYDYIISLTAAIFIYFVGYRGFTKPEMLLEYDRDRYQNSSLTSSAAKSILKKIKSYLEQEKAFTNSNLRLTQVAEYTGFSTHQISEAINSYEGVTFSDMINKYRFEEAKILLLSNTHSKIIDIGYDCGFSNKTSFNNVFKRYGGMSPSVFRKNHLESTSQV